MSATLHDIAEKTGVSISTVSRVLNNKAEKYRISTETESLILRTAQELSYRPNRLARGLRMKKSYTIGIITPDISNPFFAQVIKRVQKVAHEHGYRLIVCNTDENQELEIEHINLLYQERIDGLVAMPVGQRDDPYAEWLERGIPLVMLDRPFDSLNTNTVVVDNHRGAYEATEHLVAHEHKRIAIIQGLPGTYTSSTRLQGYREALHAHDIPFEEVLVRGSDFREHNGYIEAKWLLNMDNPPTAIFATSDLITLGVLRAVMEEGLEIPRDLSLISFDDFDFAPFLKCPLTAVRQPRELMAEMGVKLLLEDMKRGQQGTRRLVLKPKLIVRDSVAVPLKAEVP